MIEFWQKREPRERWVLIAAALVLSYILIDTLLLQPFKLHQARVADQLEQAQDDLDWMRQAITRLPPANSKPRKVVAGRVITFLDQQITRQGLKSNMQQMTPIQQHSARLRLTDVEFSHLLRFFSAIAGSINIEEIRILPADEAGLVNVSLVLSNGQEPT